MCEHDEVVIDHLGAQGDGVAFCDGAQIYVPEALPGERWRKVEEGYQRLTSSEERQTPICRHFSECGGCVAQHMSLDLYAKWKASALTTAFAHRGIEAQPEPLLSVGAGARRRTTFSFRRVGNKVVFGYHRGASHDLVGITECPVLRTEISTQLNSLCTIANLIATESVEGRMAVTVLDEGLDIALNQPKTSLSQGDRRTLSEYATEVGAVVLTLNGDPIVEARPPNLTINGATVVASDTAFLQAAAEAERWIAEAVVQATKRAKKTVDLFCGVGTFTFPLAKHSQVTAYDGDTKAISSLVESAKCNQGYKPITPLRRDLFRDPLSVRELRAFDAAVVNPPRAGAAEQCERLAGSAVKTIVMVACNPATLSRDARTLLDGGYELTRLIPIDQFVYSNHLESVAVFERPASSKRRST